MEVRLMLSKDKVISVDRDTHGIFCHIHNGFTIFGAVHPSCFLRIVTSKCSPYFLFLPSVFLPCQLYNPNSNNLAVKHLQPLWSRFEDSLCP